MRVRMLDKNWDWTFGNSKNNYVNKKDALKQNVVTRIKSCKNDWFLDSEANIDWWNILGIKSNQEIVKNEVYNTTIQTYGVISIKKIDLIVDSANRKATIKIELKTIYDDITLEVGV